MNIIFQAIGNFSFNSVINDDNSQHIAELVVDQFIKVLDNEMHEKTLVQAIQMLSLWSTNFKKNIPKALLIWFVVSMLHFIILFNILIKINNYGLDLDIYKHTMCFIIRKNIFLNIFVFF